MINCVYFKTHCFEDAANEHRNIFLNPTRIVLSEHCYFPDVFGVDFFLLCPKIIREANSF